MEQQRNQSMTTFRFKPEVMDERKNNTDHHYDHLNNC
jgi:hypothetical protein